MSGLTFVLRPESFCIHRLPRDSAFGLDQLRAASWYSVTRAEDELSVVAPEGIALGPGDRQPGWSCLQIRDTLDFAMIGVIAGIARILADAKVSIFTISTYNTDYILIRTGDVATAINALAAAGHAVTR